MNDNYFATLNSINVNEHTEKKNGLTYLSWAWAVAEIMKECPVMTYTIWKDENNRPYIYDENLGYMVFTSVTLEDQTKEMWLPVMDGANKAMKAEPYTYKVKNPNRKYAKKQADGRYIDGYGNEQSEYIEKTCEAATMFDINTAIMRCLVKNFAMFGLGLYIYAGEDLPEELNAINEEITEANNKAREFLDEKPSTEDENQKKIYILTINKLLEDTNTNGVQMIEYVNEHFKTEAKAFTDLNAEQLIFTLKKLEQKKAKAAKSHDAN